jgi:hypothetical protein
VLVPLFFIACLVALVGQWQSAGWSWRRLDRRRAYWSTVGLVLAGAVWSNSAFPGSVAAVALMAAAGLGLLCGFWWELRGRA